MIETQSAPEHPAPPAPTRSKGSLGAGIAIAWACLIGGYVAVSMFIGTLAMAMRGFGEGGLANLLVILSMLAPWIAMVWLIVHFANTGRPRTAKGIALGIASIFGVALLLIAACFGLLSNTNFH